MRNSFPHLGHFRKISSLLFRNRLNILFVGEQERFLSINKPLNNDELTLSICTFNILAPCYKRLRSEYERESSMESLWQKRHLSIIDFLKSLKIDLICLQEFWFKNKTFVDLYRSSFHLDYSSYHLQRANLVDDGLVILVKNENIRFVEKCNFVLNDIGNRVGLLLNLNIFGRSVLLFNLHLTFPHHRFERHVRWKQIRKFLDSIDRYKISRNISKDSTVILCGDFNSSSISDPIYQFVSRQYRSSYLSVHGKEPLVTHLTHRNEELPADFIFYQSNQFHPIKCELLPLGCDPSTWFDQTNWNLSDHRPLLSTFQLFS